jgi:hypothetical protein
MLLWNWLMPAIFGLPAIGLWKAWRLVILVHILFKAGRHGPDHYGHRYPHSHWKDTFREKMKRHFREKASATEALNAR